MNIYMVEYGAYVIQSPTGEVYTVDMGTPNIGRRHVIPFIVNHLKRNIITKAFATHYHYNHIGGSVPLIDSMKVQSLHTNGVYSQDTTSHYLIQDPQTKKRLYKALEHRDTTYHYHKQGEMFDEGEIKIEIWSPLEENANHGGYTEKPNRETGMMLRFVYGDFSCLFTGDITDPELIIPIWNKQDNLKTTMITAPHHGDHAAGVDEVFDPLDTKIVMTENTGITGYLDSKNIPYLHLRSTDDIHAVKGNKDGTFTTDLIPRKQMMSRLSIL